MTSTILVADDSTTMRMIVKTVLSQAGWQVLAAKDGQEALALAQTSQVDLVVSDWNMPVMGGLGLIRGLREQPQYQHTPVLVLTTEEDDISKSAARELGVSGWLNKPLDPQVLVELAAELLGETPQD
ncbi:chemotaxis two-component response regulator [Bordetella ansorpii]|uniref:Chemotaxis two-component response regulator n=1 Tax=Bordetella ansorpii TaxID=288768 RepID=A0A157PZY4_9BORD|nr:response regulator [Bordetella ansorpii]SAI38896.1 chemotaxis two-component response regulator [Bordetella ansorpii]